MDSYSNGYYWYKEFEHIGWMMVRIYRSHALMAPMALFMTCPDGTAGRVVSVEDLKGEFQGPISDPSEAWYRSEEVGATLKVTDCITPAPPESPTDDMFS